MKVAEYRDIIQADVPTEERDQVIHLPSGLLGFENYKKYILLANPEEAPFVWLQVLDEPNLAFLVISPFEVDPAYEPNILDEDVESLGIREPSDALLYNIVTVPPKGAATVNLKGPILLNRNTLVGKQVIPQNASELPVRFPLPAGN